MSLIPHVRACTQPHCCRQRADVYAASAGGDAGLQSAAPPSPTCNTAPRIALRLRHW